MIPYIEIRTVHLGSAVFPVFGLLVVLAIAAAAVVIVLWGKRRHGLPVDRLEEMCLWAVLAGAVGARLMSFAYRPGAALVALQDPRLLLSAGGIASFGGYFGGLLGLAGFFAWRRISKTERWKYLDAAGFALPFAWIFGRIGCALVHDHPGIRTSHWLGVQFPGGTRFDLGLLEVLFLALLAALFLILDRRPHAPGFFFGLFFLLYGLFRFGLDQLHVDPPRYFTITVDQYAAAAAILIGLATVVLLRRPIEAV
jgi:phosphatidylglycerol:prolipoprotein diacylglycerol transferase